VIIPLGWVASGKDQAKVARLVSDLKSQGAQMRQQLTAQILEVERNYKAGRVYWQVGNEINSRHLTESLSAALGQPAGPEFDDPQTIPMYAEYIFAPTVAALEDASRQLGGDKRRVKIILGTIANAHRPSSQAWLDQLMNYRLKGVLEPSLAGTRVADHVSIIAVHYVATADDPSWNSIFDDLDRKWRKPGIVEGIWGTEELGGKLANSGLGAATAVRVATGYLSRAARLGLPSGALRCSFFGWRWGGAGRSADTGMQMLLDILGRVRVWDLTPYVRAEGIGNFRIDAVAADDGSARVAAISNRGYTNASLDGISLTLTDVKPAKQTIATLLGERGTEVEDITGEAADGKLHYHFKTPVTIEPDETLLLRERS
jgi:hypothetical protein